MKKNLSKSRFSGWAALVLAVVWAVIIVSPRNLPAQDIDDVIQGLDQDFSLGSNKDELKRSNIETANEQNREDIKIQEDLRLKEESEENGETSPTSLTVSGTMDCSATGGSVVVMVNGSTVCSASSTSVLNQPFSFTKTAGSTLTVTGSCTTTTFCSWDFTGNVNPDNALCDIVGATVSGPPFTGPLGAAICTVQ